MTQGQSEARATLAVPQIGDIVGEKYRIERPLGQGGMGAVFEASHLVTGKRVALKWLLRHYGTNADDFERLIREARAAALIHHDGVVDIYDVGEHGGSLFLVMEYLQGRPLRAWLDRGPLQAGPLIAALLPALRGVQAAHQRGVIHRDLKPDNLFVCSDGPGEPLRTKVLDFGISKLTAAAGDREGTLTDSGMVLGTPHYMAPEQAEDSRAVDHRADIYALGVVLYEALAGAKPYTATSLTGLLLQITRGERVPLECVRPDLPRGLVRVIERAMAREARERFGNVGELIAEIERYAGGVVSDLPVRVPDTCHPAMEGHPAHRAYQSRARTFVLVAFLPIALLAAWVWSHHRDVKATSLPAQHAAAVAPTAVATHPQPAQDPPHPATRPHDGAPATASAPHPAPPSNKTTASITYNPTTKPTGSGSTPKPEPSPEAARAPAPPLGTSTPTRKRRPHGRLAIDMRREQF